MKKHLNKLLLLSLLVLTGCGDTTTSSLETTTKDTLTTTQTNLDSSSITSSKAEINKDEKVSFKAIYFDIDTQILIDRIVARQSCPKCGEIYNKKFKPSKVENICDRCGTELKTRADDNEETARARFDTYFRETAPLVEFYEKKGVLYKIDANGSIDEVWERLLKVINA